MTVALYCRVSTDEQAQTGHSIDTQRDRLIAYCAAQGWTDYKLYIDDGYTGKNTDRPALQRLLGDIDRKVIETVVVYKLDRLSRRQRDIMYLLEDVFDAKDVAFRSVTESFDTSSSFGKAMLGILAVFAQFERETIVERMRSGRRTRILKGLWSGGRIPLGYDYDQEAEKLVPNEEEARIIRGIFSRYLRGSSLSELADWAALQTGARVFDHGRIAEILDRETYIGRMYSGDVPVDETFEPLIERDVFDRVQAERKRRKEGRRPPGHYLLSGLLRCSLCGSPVIHRKYRQRGHEYDYYECKKHFYRPRHSTDAPCKHGAHRMEDLDNFVVSRLRKLAALDFDQVAQVTESSRVVDDVRGEIEALESRLEDVKRRIQRLVDIYEDGTIDRRTMNTRIQTLREESRTIEQRLDDLYADEGPRRTSGGLQRILAMVDSSWDLLSFDEQKSIIHAAVDHVVVYPRRTLRGPETDEHTIIWDV